MIHLEVFKKKINEAGTDVGIYGYTVSQLWINDNSSMYPINQSRSLSLQIKKSQGEITLFKVSKTSKSMLLALAADSQRPRRTVTNAANARARVAFYLP